jgi:hypothetical protein
MDARPRGELLPRQARRLAPGRGREAELRADARPGTFHIESGLGPL